MNNTTTDLLDKVEKLFNEYAFEDVEGDILRKEINRLIDNRS